MLKSAGGGGAGGASTPFNVTPDTHLASPVGVGIGPNDEFETASLDTAGTRYTGASAWSWNNQQFTTATQAEGSLLLSAPANNPNQNSASVIYLPIASGTTYNYRVKMASATPGNQCFSGFTFFNSTTLQYAYVAFYNNGGGLDFFCNTQSSGVIRTAGLSSYWPQGSSFPTYWTYLDINVVSNVVSVGLSLTGIDGTFTAPWASFNLSSYFSSAPDSVGLHCYDQTDNGSGLPTLLLCDWFRRLS